MLPKLKKYDKDFDFSYTYGIFPTLELLKKKKETVHEVILDPDSQDHEGIRDILKLCEDAGISVLFNRQLIEKLSVKENTYAIGVFSKYTSPLIAETDHLVLVNPSNMGNLGTIIRTMVGFKVYSLAMISPAVDIFSPMVIRSAMGAFFKINFEYFESIGDYFDKFRDNKMYSFFLDGDKEINQAKFEHPFSLIFGNEGAGLSEDIRGVSDTVYIKHEKDIDSLNLAVCAGIVLHKIYEAN